MRLKVLIANGPNVAVKFVHLAITARVMAKWKTAKGSSNGHKITIMNTFSVVFDDILCVY